jgi:hypothetical protein
MIYDIQTNELFNLMSSRFTHDEYYDMHLLLILEVVHISCKELSTIVVIELRILHYVYLIALL